MDSGRELMNLRFSSIGEFIPHRQSLLRICEENCGPVDGLALFVSLNEAVNNALLHGNRDIPEGAVNLALRTEGSRLCIDIRSAGQERLLPSLPNHSLQPDGFRESGRGLHIMRSLVDYFSIEETGLQVTLCMEKNPGEETNP